MGNNVQTNVRTAEYATPSITGPLSDPYSFPTMFEKSMTDVYSNPGSYFTSALEVLDTLMESETAVSAIEYGGTMLMEMLLLDDVTRTHYALREKVRSEAGL